MSENNRRRERATPIGDDVGRAKERALRLLAVRPRSRAELAERLARAGAAEETVARVLADLAEVGLLDDERFARELSAYRLEGRLEGRRAVRAALRARGVDTALADRVVQDVGDEEARAERLARTRAARLAGERPERAFARLVGFLQRRGYGYGVAARAARAALDLEVDLD